MIFIADMWSYPKNLSNWYPKRIWWRKRNGDQSVCSSRAVGYIIWYISRSRIFCYFDVPRRRSSRFNAILHTHTLTLTHIRSAHLPTSTCMHTHTHISVQIQLIYGAAASATAQLVVAAAAYSQKSHTHTHTHLPPLCYAYIASQQQQQALPHASVFITICTDSVNI